MKKTFKALACGFGYLLIFIAVQFIVAGGYAFATVMQYALELTADGVNVSCERLIGLTAEKIYGSVNLIAAVSGILTLLVFLIIFAARRKNPLKEVSLTKILPKDALLILLMGFCANVLSAFVIEHIPFPESRLNSYISNSTHIGEGNHAIMYFAGIIVAPLVEEVTFRGLLYTRLKNGMPAAAAAVSAACFGILHGTVIWFIYTFAFGLLLSWLFEKYRSLTACLALHMGFNSAGTLLGDFNIQSVPVTVIVLVAALLAFAGCLFYINKNAAKKADVKENN